MQNLHQYLDEASRMYYTGNPTISDGVFDALAASIGYNKIGTKADNEEEHLYPLYSLQKYYEDEGACPLSEYSANDKDISPKIDGACIELLYIGRKLIRALTRGDGIKGKLITDKCYARPDFVPLNIPWDFPVQISGEVAAPKEIENSRNYAAGSLNLKNVDEFKTRAVQFIAHGVHPAIRETFDKDMKTLSKLGFSTIKDAELHNIFPCDGIVFRINNNKEFYSLGYTSQHPKGAYALKERGKAVVTTLLDVIWQTAKTGRVTPVAILEPVYIGDALISRATLNNAGFIEALDLQLGDKVAIIRAGDIIPCVLHKVE